MKLGLQTEGITEIQGRFADLVKRGNDMRKPLRIVERYMREDARELFKTEGGSGRHGKWPARKPVKRRKGRRRRGKILQRTRRLKRAVTTARPSDRRTTITSRDLVVLITLPYAAVHHYGLGKMPRRRIFDPTDKQVERYMAPLIAWLTTQDLSRFKGGRRRGASGASGGSSS